MVVVLAFVLSLLLSVFVSLLLLANWKKADTEAKKASNRIDGKNKLLNQALSKASSSSPEFLKSAKSKLYGLVWPSLLLGLFTLALAFITALSQVISHAGELMRSRPSQPDLEALQSALSVKFTQGSLALVLASFLCALGMIRTIDELMLEITELAHTRGRVPKFEREETFWRVLLTINFLHGLCSFLDCISFGRFSSKFTGWKEFLRRAERDVFSDGMVLSRDGTMKNWQDDHVKRNPGSVISEHFLWSSFGRLFAFILLSGATLTLWIVFNFQETPSVWTTILNWITLLAVTRYAMVADFVGKGRPKSLPPVFAEIVTLTLVGGVLLALAGALVAEFDYVVWAVLAVIVGSAFFILQKLTETKVSIQDLWVKHFEELANLIKNGDEPTTNLVIEQPAQESRQLRDRPDGI
jgi:hypothetical protein